MSDWFAAATRPQRVAVLGASTDAARSPYVRNLQAGGFGGVILPINNRASEVLGLPSYRSLADLPGPVDSVIVNLPASQVVAALAPLAGTSARFVYVGSGGFAELDAEGGRAQDRVVEIVRSAGARLLGPNGNGVINTQVRLWTTAMSLSDHDLAPPRGSRAALVTQSGALGAAIRSDAYRAGLDITHYFSMGNEADLDTADVVAELADEPGLDSILIYLEGVRDGARFAAAVTAARAKGKRLVAVKIGRSAAGERVAASHTASIAGDSAVFFDVCDQLGVALVESTTQLIEVGLLAAGPLPAPDTRVGVVSISGGMGALLVDGLPAGFVVPPAWPDAVRAAIADDLPPFVSGANPLDGAAHLVGSRKRFERVLTAIHASDSTDMTIVGLTYLHSMEGELALAIAGVAAARPGKPLYVAWVGSQGVARAYLADRGVPTFDDIPPITHALRALSAMSVRPPRAHDVPVVEAAQLPGVVAQLLDDARSAGASVLDEIQGKRLLAAAGLDVVADTVVARTSTDSWSAADLAFPVVAKLVSPSLTHKSDLGGVRLGLDDAVAVTVALRELFAIADARGLTDAVVTLQPQVAAGSELLVGMHRDAVFGPVLVLGHGGVMAEALDDVRIAMAPVTGHEVEIMFGKLRHQRLTAGFRGRPPVATTAAIEAVVRFGQLAARLPNWVTSVDVNPLVVTGDGRAVVVDALFVLEPAGESAAAPARAAQ